MVVEVLAERVLENGCVGGDTGIIKVLYEDGIGLPLLVGLWFLCPWSREQRS